MKWLMIISIILEKFKFTSRVARCIDGGDTSDPGRESPMIPLVHTRTEQKTQKKFEKEDDNELKREEEDGNELKREIREENG